MAKKFYKFTGNLDQAIKEKMPLQQKQILKAMHEMTTGKNKDKSVQGFQVIEYAIKHCKLETKQKPQVLFAWYAKNNIERGYAKVVENI